MGFGAPGYATWQNAMVVRQLIPATAISNTAICFQHYSLCELDYVIQIPFSHAAKVVNLEKEAGKTYSLEELETAIKDSKAAVLFLCQVGRVCRSEMLFMLDMLWPVALPSLPWHTRSA